MRTNKEKIDVDSFVAVLEAQALKNDGKMSEDEQTIIDAVSLLDKDSAYDVYLTILKAAYSDKKIPPDQEDLIRMARDILKISKTDHQRALIELEL